MSFLRLLVELQAQRAISELPGEDASRPLRSFEEPDGISGLTGL